MANPIDVVVTVEEARGITCPYTGDPVEVHMIVRPGSIVYYAPNAFTLAEPVSDLNVLLSRSTMRRGVTGAVSMAEGKLDARTGDELTLRKLPDGRVSFVGGFNPRAVCQSPPEFLYKLTMVDGKATRPKPVEPKPIEKPTVTRYVTHQAIEPGDATLDHAASVVQSSGLFEKKTVVSIPGAPSQGRGKRK